MSTPTTEETTTTTAPPTILVIGGGPAALTSIAQYRKLFASSKRTQVSLTNPPKIVLVEPKDYCEIAWATFRTPFDADIADQTLLPLAPWCKEYDVTHVRALVTKLTETEATLDNGETLPFTMCLICAGATALWKGLGRGPAKLTKEERLAQLKEQGDTLLNAKSVCIVGGGLIGAELAGDLADFAKEQGKPVRVTLVHSGPHLCSMDCTKGCGNMIQAKLEVLGVQVILNEKAQKTDDGKVQLINSDQTIEADQVVMTTGVYSVNNSFMDPKYLDDKGWIQVDPTFRVKDSKTLMSVGDCCNFLMNAANQVFTNKDKIAHNIKAVLEERVTGTALPLKNGAPFEVLKITTTGRNDGVAQMPLGMYTQYLIPAYKNKGLFISDFKNFAGYGQYDETASTEQS